MSNRNVPELRLEDFSDSWKEESLADIATYSKGQGYSKADMTEEGTPLFHYGRLYTKYELAVTDVDTFSKVHADSILSRGDEVLVPASGETAEDIATASALLQPGVLLGGDLNVIKPHSGFDSVFLALSLSHGEPKAALAKRARGNSVVHVHNPDIQSLIVLFPPTVEEQRAIGAVFRKLDTTIHSHRKKLDLLKQTKTALMQKMFPQDGQTEPELRLGGFDGEWDSSEFGDIAHRSTLFSDTPGLPRVEYEDIHSGLGILNKDLRAKQSTKVGIYFQPGDVLYGKLRPYLKNWLLTDFEGIAVGDFWVLRSREADPHFIYTLIQTNRFSETASISSGSKMPRADWALVAQTQLPVPPTVEEQQAIGAVFTKLDSLINTETQYIDKLTQTKTALLQKMFV